jgi:hypothetical protein
MGPYTLYSSSPEICAERLGYVGRSGRVQPEKQGAMKGGFRYVWMTTIDDISRRSTTVCGRRDAAGNAVLTVEDAGWYIRCGNVSHFCGYDEPIGYKKGDKVRLILEHAEMGKCLEATSVSVDPKLGSG